MASPWWQNFDPVLNEMLCSPIRHVVGKLHGVYIISEGHDVRITLGVYLCPVKASAMYM